MGLIWTEVARADVACDGYVFFVFWNKFQIQRTYQTLQ